MSYVHVSQPPFLANATGSAGIAQAGSERAGHETGVGTVETDS
jgi:hypothetical protein